MHRLHMAREVAFSVTIDKELLSKASLSILAKNLLNSDMQRVNHEIQLCNACGFSV